MGHSTRPRMRPRASATRYPTVSRRSSSAVCTLRQYSPPIVKFPCPGKECVRIRTASGRRKARENDRSHFPSSPQSAAKGSSGQSRRPFGRTSLERLAAGLGGSTSAADAGGPSLGAVARSAGRAECSRSVLRRSYSVAPRPTTRQPPMVVIRPGIDPACDAITASSAAATPIPDVAARRTAERGLRARPELRGERAGPPAARGGGSRGWERLRGTATRGPPCREGGRGARSGRASRRSWGEVPRERGRVRRCFPRQSPSPSAPAAARAAAASRARKTPGRSFRPSFRARAPAAPTTRPGRRGAPRERGLRSPDRPGRVRR